MAVVLNEPALRLLLESPTGPVGAEVIARAERVREIARANASGGWLNIDTGDLVGSLRLMREGVDAKGFFVVVGADAEHRGFRYPGFWDENGRPWLSEAVADVFP